MNSKIHRRLQLLDTKGRELRIRGLRGGFSSEINITPLVDVVLVLLIIFMLVLPKIDVSIALPEAFDPEKIVASEKTTPINIGMKLGNLVSINDSPFEKLEEAELLSRIEKAVKKDPRAPVYLAADENLQFKDIRAMLSVLRDAGAPMAGLVSKRIIEEELED